MVWRSHCGSKKFCCEVGKHPIDDFMTTHICQACGGQFSCGLADNPNVCKSCELLADFSADTSRAGRQVLSQHVCDGAAQTCSLPPNADSGGDTFGRCNNCEAFAPMVVSNGGQLICPSCKQQEIESLLFPVSQSGSSNTPTSPEPRPAVSLAPDSLARPGALPGATAPRFAVACGKFNLGMIW